MCWGGWGLLCLKRGRGRACNRRRDMMKKHKRGKMIRAKDQEPILGRKFPAGGCDFIHGLFVLCFRADTMPALKSFFEEIQRDDKTPLRYSSIVGGSKSVGKYRPSGVEARERTAKLTRVWSLSTYLHRNRSCWNYFQTGHCLSLYLHRKVTE